MVTASRLATGLDLGIHEDGPQNQIESKPRIEVLPVESETGVNVHKMLAVE